jgi:hypothetical protein
MTEICAGVAMAPSLCGGGKRAKKSQIDLTHEAPYSAKFHLMLGVIATLLILMAETSGHAANPPDSLVKKVTVIQQEWRREGKVMLANITLENGNKFSVKNVIVTCEIYEEIRMPQNKRGVTVRRVLPPGRTTVSDLAFPISSNDAQGGSCQVLSAQKV